MLVLFLQNKQRVNFTTALQKRPACHCLIARRSKLKGWIAILFRKSWFWVFWLVLSFLLHLYFAGHWSVDGKPLFRFFMLPIPGVFLAWFLAAQTETRIVSKLMHLAPFLCLAPGAYHKLNRLQWNWGKMLLGVRDQVEIRHALLRAQCGWELSLGWVSKWRWKFWQCRSFIFIASQSPIAGNAETALSVSGYHLVGPGWKFAWKFGLAMGTKEHCRVWPFHIAGASGSMVCTNPAQKNIAQVSQDDIVASVQGSWSYSCKGLFFPLTGSHCCLLMVYASLARRGWLLDVGAFYEFLEDGPCRYLGLSFFLWLFFTNVVNKMPLWNMHCVLVDASKSAIMFWVQKQQGFHPDGVDKHF